MKNLNLDKGNENQAESIGSIAFKSLGEVENGTVFGRTSGGIFFKTESKWLNFLSFERYRGPLTINLSPEDSSIPDINPGMKLEISRNALYYPGVGFRVSLKEAEVWQPPPAIGSLVARDDRRVRMVKLADKIMENDIESGLAPLLPQLLDMTSQEKSGDNIQPGLSGKILHLQHEMKSSGTLPASSNVSSLLGLGSGLTPSGDDFILGMLLAFNRWKDLFRNLHELDQFNRQVVESAYQKTTTLSANLIECASKGLGNERLINTLDWLVSGGEEEAIPVDNLLSWGSSSGIDVFVGCVVALSN